MRQLARLVVLGWLGLGCAGGVSPGTGDGGSQATVPGAPTGVTAQAGDGAAAVRWTAPASDGGRPISGYTVAVSPPAAGATVHVNATTASVTGLTNGTAYQFTVSATNAVGTGPASQPSAPVTPTSSVGLPTGLAYATNPASYTVGVAIPPDIPSSSGGAPSSYAVSPALPTGLVLDPLTGVISGTPGAPVASAAYQVTASNGAGSASVSLTITVSAAQSIFPLAISPSKNLLVDASGRPFLVQGDAAWSAIAQLSEADALLYLDDRQSRGFNAILVNLVEHSFTSHRPNWANAAGNVPFTGTVPGQCPSTGGTTGCNDLSTPNDAYFQHVDWFLQRARERNILVLLAPAYLGYAGPNGTDGWFNDMQATGTTGLTAYGRYLGARYGAAAYPNLLWVNGCDYTPSGSQVALVNALVDGIKAGGGTQLMTAHWGGEPSYGSYGPQPRPTWIDVDTVYVESAPHNYQFTQPGYLADHGVRPVLFIEGPYEDEAVVAPPAPTSPLQLRSDMYQPILSGETGFVFGNDPIWNFWTGPDTSQNNFYDAYAGQFPDWKSALPSSGGRAATIASQFFAPLDWMHLVPDDPNGNQNLLTSGTGSWGSDRYVLGARTPDGRLGLAYFTFLSTVTVDMTRMSGSTIAAWFDPSNATTTAVPGGPFAASGSRSFTPPGANGDGSSDWVLLLQAN